MQNSDLTGLVMFRDKPLTNLVMIIARTQAQVCNS
jgi:hypothetical protein